MKQYEIKVDFEIEVAKTGRIFESVMKKVLKHLANFQDGTYFITDCKGNETCWDVLETSSDIYVDCEITSGDIDHYNKYCVPKCDGKFDYENSDYETYEV